LALAAFGFLPRLVKKIGLSTNFIRILVNLSFTAKVTARTRTIGPYQPAKLNYSCFRKKANERIEIKGKFSKLLQYKILVGKARNLAFR
jgi:hypothetical protein